MVRVEKVGKEAAEDDKRTAAAAAAAIHRAQHRQNGAAAARGLGDKLNFPKAEQCGTGETKPPPEPLVYRQPGNHLAWPEAGTQDADFGLCGSPPPVHEPAAA